MSNKNLDIIGSNTLIDINNHHRVPAKIDTGADSSAIWASQIELTDKGILRFALFDKQSPYYTGELLERKDVKTTKVRSSNGQEEVRYRVCIPITINGRKIRATFTLADRSRNIFPVLIGRRTIKHKFLVDVSRNVIPEPTKETKPLKQEITSHPVQPKKSTIKTKKQPTEEPVKKANPTILLHSVLKNNNYKKVAPAKPRSLYFEKYKNSYALSNVLLGIHRLLKTKKIDLRTDFIKIYPLIQLRRFVNRLLTDPKALLYLSSYAVNIICLSEILYPRHHDYTNKLARIALSMDPDAHPALYVELCTQIIIADSHYFTRPVSRRNKLLLRQLLRRASVYLESFKGNIPKNVKQKFLACAKLVGQEKEYLQKMTRKTEKV